MNIRRVLIVGILAAVAALAPRPGACDTYVRDDLNLLRADTFSGIQRRNADLIARTGACIDVITTVTAGDNPGKYAVDTALGFGNHCSIGAVILIMQNGNTMIRFEDASAGINSQWQSISQDLGKGMEAGDTSGAVMNVVNEIADGIISHPAPSPPPVVYATPPPPPNIVESIGGLILTNWQTSGGRIAIFAIGILALVLLVRSAGFGRSR
jgi:uncharacterized membrane protein YgcG